MAHSRVIVPPQRAVYQVESATGETPGIQLQQLAGHGTQSCLTVHTHNVQYWCHFHLRRPLFHGFFLFLPRHSLNLTLQHKIFVFVVFLLLIFTHSPGVCFHSRPFFHALLHRLDRLRRRTTAAAAAVESRIQL